MSRLQEMADKEAEFIENDLMNGNITKEEYEQQMSELRQEFREEAHEEAMRYYDDLMGH